MSLYAPIVQELLAASHIVITSHKSPDGDSVGSSLGMYHFLQKLGKQVSICHPDPAPEFLLWLEGAAAITTMTEHPAQVETHFGQADVIIALDYNAPDRIGSDMQKLMEASTAKKIMIDHHLDPKDFVHLAASDPEASSTSEMLVRMMVESGYSHLLDARIGTPLYLGILTDSGSFRFSSVKPETHRVIAHLLEGGVLHHLVHEQLTDNNTASRMRLQGYAMSHKLDILEDYKVAILSLTEEEHRRYQYQKGDTDGLPNLALSIKGMKVAMLVSERDGYIKISFRSKGKENPVNVLAAEHFEGGGHANAAGGRSDVSMQETLDKIHSLIPLYFEKSVGGPS